jgi:hypothetical protein
LSEALQALETRSKPTLETPTSLGEGCGSPANPDTRIPSTSASQINDLAPNTAYMRVAAQSGEIFTIWDLNLKHINQIFPSTGYPHNSDQLCNWCSLCNLCEPAPIAQFPNLFHLNRTYYISTNCAPCANQPQLHNSSNLFSLIIVHLGPKSTISGRHRPPRASARVISSISNLN